MKGDTKMAQYILKDISEDQKEILEALSYFISDKQVAEFIISMLEDCKTGSPEDLFNNTLKLKYMIRVMGSDLDTLEENLEFWHNPNLRGYILENLKREELRRENMLQEVKNMNIKEF